MSRAESVHPRLRGELGGTNIPCSAICGSSPLTRGTLFWDFIEEVDERFIPAYAGNSGFVLFLCSDTSVHPRLRGELLNVMAGVPNLVGSSPLTRGTQTDNVTVLNKRRFIPAYAGNSSRTSVGLPRTAVHPRLRGELIVLKLFSREKVGSSPLTRGTPVRLCAKYPFLRFIPAYAGNSPEPSVAPVIVPVHPRLRGELPATGIFGKEFFGSSPLTRGTRYQLNQHRQKVRFIPAYAGNSLKMVTTLH